MACFLQRIFPSVAFAMGNDVEQEDVNILVAGQHQKQANATESKVTLGTMFSKLGPLLQTLKSQHGPGPENDHFTLRGTHF